MYVLNERMRGAFNQNSVGKLLICTISRPAALTELISPASRMLRAWMSPYSVPMQHPCLL